MRTDEFTATLPRGPLTQHIRQVHAVLIYQCSGLPGDPNALAVAEHCLREMARYTAADPRLEYGMPARREWTPSRDLYEAAQRSLVGLGDRMREVAESIKAKRTPEQIDAYSASRLSTRIVQERRLGLAFVKDEADRARKELGL